MQMWVAIQFDVSILAQTFAAESIPSVCVVPEYQAIGYQFQMRQVIACGAIQVFVQGKRFGSA